MKIGARTLFKISLLFVIFFHIDYVNGQNNEPNTNNSFQKDSFYFSSDAYNFNKFQLISNKSPLALYRQGIFMPKENIWYYIPTQKNTKLIDFSLFPSDTSIIVLEKINNSISLSKIKLVSNFFYPDKKNIKKLFTSNDTSFKRVFPLNDKCFFLLKKDSLFHIYRNYKNKSEKILSPKISIQNIIPVDTSTLIIHSGKLVFLYQRNSGARVLFNNKLPIISIAMDKSGKIFYSDKSGIYEYKLEQKQQILIDNNIKDAVLETFTDKLYALSSSIRNMYYYKMKNRIR